MLCVVSSSFLTVVRRVRRFLIRRTDRANLPLSAERWSYARDREQSGSLRAQLSRSTQQRTLGDGRSRRPSYCVLCVTPRRGSHA